MPLRTVVGGEHYAFGSGGRPSVNTHSRSAFTTIWAPAGFFPRVGNLGVWRQKSPAESRHGAPVGVWGKNEENEA